MPKTTDCLSSECQTFKNKQKYIKISKTKKNCVSNSLAPKSKLVNFR